MMGFETFNSQFTLECYRVSILVRNFNKKWLSHLKFPRKLVNFCSCLLTWYVSLDTFLLQVSLDVLLVIRIYWGGLQEGRGSMQISVDSLKIGYFVQFWSPRIIFLKSIRGYLGCYIYYLSFKQTQAVFSVMNDILVSGPSIKHNPPLILSETVQLHYIDLTQ